MPTEQLSPPSSLNHTRRVLFPALILAIIFLAAVAPAQMTLTTSFGGVTMGAGNMFNVKALNGVIINSFDVHIAPGTGDFEVWALNTTGSYVGNETSNANWTLLASPTGIASGGWFSPTPLSLNLGFAIPSGQIQAFYIHRTNGQLNYDVGNFQGNLVAFDANLEFYEGNEGGYFNVINTPRTWNGNIHYGLLPTVSDDIQMNALIAPTNNQIGCNPKSATEAVTIELRSFGSNPVVGGTFIPVSFQVDALPPVMEFALVTTPMGIGDTLQYTFTATADLSAVGNHTLTVSASYLLDLEPSNDSIVATIGSGGQLRITSFPYSEDFPFTGPGTQHTNPPFGFINEPGDSGPDWFMRNTNTPNINSGPAADHTTGVSGMGGYAYVDGGTNGSTVNLRTPCFDLGTLANPYVRFWLHSLAGNGPGSANMLSIDVIDYTTAMTTADVFGPIGHVGNMWTLQSGDLTAFAGHVVQLVFRANSALATSHDLAIDDLSVVDLQATPGQAPQFGKAVLEMNTTTNVNGDPLSLGFGGPYVATATPGDLLVFNIEGEPLHNIILFGGVLNPVVASFPIVGTIDVGSLPLDPLTGIPSGIVVLADGSLGTGLDGFFKTSATGDFTIGATVPGVPPGVLSTFQCAVNTSTGPLIALSNAVTLTIL